MYFIIIVFLIVAPQMGFAQTKKLVGNWQGVLTQPNNGKATLTTSYVFYMDFKVKGDSVYGLSRIEVANTDNFGVIEFYATIKNDTVRFQETRITEKNIIKGAYWCIKRGFLVLSKDKKSMDGTWFSTPRCGPGDIHLTKSTEEFNDSIAENFEHTTIEDLTEQLENKNGLAAKKVVLKNLYFQRGKAILLDSSKQHLQPLVELMQAYPKLRIKITGHTDNTGHDILNQKLSEKRANAVRRYILEQKIRPYRVIAQGFGESRPIAPNDTEENKKLNRRIEFEIIAQ